VASERGIPAILGGQPALERVPSAPSGLHEAAIAEVAACLREAPLSTLFGGYEVGRFEQEFAEWVGTTEAVAVSSGTSALYASLLAAEVGPGDEVIVTPFSFIASVSVVIEAGARPIFADVDSDSLCIDPRDVRSKVSPNTRCILPVHHFGIPADMPSLQQIAADTDALLIEDCAHAPGSSLAGSKVGSLGDLGCFSFHAHKILSTGEGGMVATSSPELAEALREIRVNGLSPGRGVVRFGVNATMAQPLAALGRFELRRLDARILRRDEIGRWLIEELSDLPLAAPPRMNGQEVQRVFYGLPLVLPPGQGHYRDRLLAALKAEHIPVSTPYTEALYSIPYLGRFSPDPPCHVAEDILRRYIVLDVLESYSDDEIAAISAGFHKVFAELESLPDVEAVMAG
jgi:perosamine synthetase